MAKFCDRHGKEWTIDITVGSCKRVRQKTGVVITDLLAEKMKPLAELVSNQELLVDVLYVLCEPQAEKEGVTDEQFGEAMAGDSLDDAYHAFMGGLADFFPKRQREMIKSLSQKVDQLSQTLASNAAEEIENLNMDSLISSVSNSPELQASSRGPIRSVN